MTIYYFDEEKARGVCEQYMSGVAKVHLADHQADVDGFWRVLNSVAGQRKLLTEPSRDPHGIIQAKPVLTVLDAVAEQNKAKVSFEQPARPSPPPLTRSGEEEDQGDG